MARLLWALPAVLAVGAAVIIVLRRFVVPAPHSHGKRRLIALESMPLSNETRAHLIEVDGVKLLIVESTLSVVQTQSLHPHTRDTPSRVQPAWLRRFSGITR